MHRLHAAAQPLPCGVDPNGRVPESFFCVRPVDVDLSSMSQMPPGRDFFVWAVMAEAKVDNFGRTPASRTRSKNGSSCVGGWVPRDLTLPAHETGKGRPHPD